ncbi:MAG: hypothetical protein H0V12_06230 [Chloroflexi bacterium]|jgi:hypothetical protein|nr:hypothetical protein [Chloroflexota bacterium]
MSTLLDLPPFLEDWKSDHRPLSDDQREHVGAYIAAILRRSAGDGAEPADAPVVTAHARALWQAFRLGYDDLRGPYQCSEPEDVGRALSSI